MKLNPSFILRKVSGENMLVNTEAKGVDMTAVFSLNDSAAWLWNRIGDSEIDEDLLVEWICGEYEVEEDVARRDIRDMLALWGQYGMIV